MFPCVSCPPTYLPIRATIRMPPFPCCAAVHGHGQCHMHGPHAQQLARVSDPRPPPQPGRCQRGHAQLLPGLRARPVSGWMPPGQRAAPGPVTAVAVQAPRLYRKIESSSAADPQLFPSCITCCCRYTNQNPQEQWRPIFVLRASHSHVVQVRGPAASIRAWCRDGGMGGWLQDPKPTQETPAAAALLLLLLLRGQAVGARRCGTSSMPC